jgi:teichuronic acid biosynthesis glycosyltransferase TuaG
MRQKESKQKKVSIILPNYNSHKYISSTINSILKQNYKNWELIIIDDCSNKKTREKLLEYKNNKKIKIFWLKRNRGAGFCRNFAIKKSKAEFLAFIDSDDIWEKNKLQTQIRFMEKNKYNFTYTYYKTFNDGETKFNKIITPIKFDFKSFTHNTSIATSTMIIKKKTINNIKFTNTPICEDYFYKCETIKKTKFAYCLNKYLTKYRIRNNSLQSNKMKNFYWIWKINKDYNKFNFIKNFFSLFFISLNSIKKYGF